MVAVDFYYYFIIGHYFSFEERVTYCTVFYFLYLFLVQSLIHIFVFDFGTYRDAKSSAPTKKPFAV